MSQIKNKKEKWASLIYRLESKPFQIRIAGLIDNFRRGGKVEYSPSADAFFGIIFSFICTIYARTHTYDTNLTSVLYGSLAKEYLDKYNLALKDSKIHYEKLKEILHLLPAGFGNFCVTPILQIPVGKTLTYDKAIEFVKFVEEGGIEKIMRKIWREK